MTVSWRSLGTVALLAAVVTLLQLSVFGRIELFGAPLNVIPVAAAACGFFAGPVAGAAAGFAFGLMLDLLTGATLGVSSLVLTLVGYATGRWRELRDPATTLVSIPLGGSAALAYGMGFTTVSYMLDIGDVARVSPLLLREIAAGALLSGAVAPLVFAAVRKVLRPLLAFDPLERRRRRELRRTGPIGLRGLDI